MAYQMAGKAVTLNDLEGHSPVAGLFKCNLSNIKCVQHFTRCQLTVLARFLCISIELLAFYVRQFCVLITVNQRWDGHVHINLSSLTHAFL